MGKGVVQVVDEEPRDGEYFEGGMTYLPHCEVTREDKSSIKLRIVYEASAKGKNDVSLNDCFGLNVVRFIFEVSNSSNSNYC